MYDGGNAPWLQSQNSARHSLPNPIKTKKTKKTKAFPGPASYPHVSNQKTKAFPVPASYLHVRNQKNQSFFPSGCFGGQFGRKKALVFWLSCFAHQIGARKALVFLVFLVSRGSGKLCCLPPSPFHDLEVQFFFGECFAYKSVNLTTLCECTSVGLWTLKRALHWKTAVCEP